MLFNSFIFLLFGATFFILWPLMRSQATPRWGLLTVSSFIFYGWWDWRFLILLVVTGFIDYLAALAMVRYPLQRKVWLLLSMGANLGSLGIFKYSLFFAQNLDALFAFVGIESHLQNAIPPFALILPVGISFYTFQSMSYTIDVYRGDLKPVRNLWHFYAWLSLFPQLVAGPIIRAADLLEQLDRVRVPSESERWHFTLLIISGFFKKVVLADNIAPFVNDLFAQAAPGSALQAWAAVTGFAFQIYFDFSGYSDIAIGLMGWMGYKVAANFRMPYHARSLREFWARWHISLSTWFRDYVYIPLGGSQEGAGRAFISLWVTMLLSGFWHGASWNFLIWGALHAAGMSIERAGGLHRLAEKNSATAWFGRLWTLLFVWVGWVFFRANGAEAAFRMLGSMFGGGATAGIEPIFALWLGAGICWIAAEQIKPGRWQWVLAVAGILACIFLRGPGSQFIYFQF